MKTVASLDAAQGLPQQSKARDLLGKAVLFTQARVRVSSVLPEQKVSD